MIECFLVVFCYFVLVGNSLLVCMSIEKLVCKALSVSLYINFACIYRNFRLKQLLLCDQNLVGN